MLIVCLSIRTAGDCWRKPLGLTYGCDLDAWAPPPPTALSFCSVILGRFPWLLCTAAISWFHHSHAQSLKINLIIWKSAQHLPPYGQLYLTHPYYALIPGVVQALSFPQVLNILIHCYLFIFGCTGSSLLCVSLSLVSESRSNSLVAVYGLLIAVASLFAEHKS